MRRNTINVQYLSNHLIIQIVLDLKICCPNLQKVLIELATLHVRACTRKGKHWCMYLSVRIYIGTVIAKEKLVSQKKIMLLCMLLLRFGSNRDFFYL